MATQTTIITLGTEHPSFSIEYEDNPIPMDCDETSDKKSCYENCKENFQDDYPPLPCVTLSERLFFSPDDKTHPKPVELPELAPDEPSTCSLLSAMDRILSTPIKKWYREQHFMYLHNFGTQFWKIVGTNTSERLGAARAGLLQNLSNGRITLENYWDIVKNWQNIWKLANDIEKESEEDVDMITMITPLGEGVEGIGKFEIGE